MTVSAKIIPVILCGGSGTRLWPASREYYPKQFLNLTGDLSLLQQTMRRSLRETQTDFKNLVIVTLDHLKPEVEKQIEALHPAGIPHIILEPCAKNTAGAVALAALYVAEHFGKEAIMWVLPADHHIGDEKALHCAADEGIKAAQDGYLVTFGIKPTRPETGYGYIRIGKAIKDNTVYSAEEFVEKPSRQTAQAYLDSGAYLWNSGMFLFSAESVLSQFERHAPAVLACVRDAVKAGTSAQPEKETYSHVEEIPFDKAIMERISVVAVVPCNPAWSDIGSWESLWEIRPKDTYGNAVTGRAVCHETSDCLIESEDRLIACAGVKDIVIIDRKDVLLIADKKDSELIKSLVKSLKNLSSQEAYHPADRIEASNISSRSDFPEADDDYEIQQIKTYPKNPLFFGPHDKAGLFWAVMEGGGSLVIDSSQPIKIKSGMTVPIPAHVPYFVIPTGQKKLSIIEIIKTKYDSEKDISLNTDKTKKAA